MDLATGAASSSPYFTRFSNPYSYRRISSSLKTYRHKHVHSLPEPIKCHRNPNPILSFSCSSALTETPLGVSELSSCKLQRFVSEFQSLSEPIDRVKRLLHYATLLPPFHDTKRVPANRVTGCTAQVWLDASMDGYGRMRFSADSDSEIAKGFSSCLVSILDGAFPDEVLALKTEDFAALNVGLPGRAHSRVNTWHNVLITMQKRTKSLLAAKEGKPQASRRSFPISGCHNRRYSCQRELC